MSKEFYEIARRLAAAAVHHLPDRWNDKKVNRSGLRATFRRWRPDANGEPTMEMREAIWDDRYLFAIIPAVPSEESPDDQREREWHTNRMIDEAAILVSLRAIAGEKGSSSTFGKALLLSGISDTRFARLVTTPKSGRLETLRRTLQAIEGQGVGIDWTKEARNFHSFLFGAAERSKRAVDTWAADFFRERGKAQQEANATAESTETKNENE